MKIYDTFKPNYLESEGKIERNSFHFIADNCKIWHKGKCLYEIHMKFAIKAIVNSDSKEIVVSIDNVVIKDYIIDTFMFSEISSTTDRILWSNNLLNGGAGADVKEPSMMSIFFYKGNLSRINFNVYNPVEILIQFRSNNHGEISDVENSVLKMAEDIQKLKQKQVVLSNISFDSTTHQRYENDLPVNGIQVSRRIINIEENINGCEGYDIEDGDGFIVTIYNQEGIHPIWGNNVQMTPKPMRIINKTSDKITLQGYTVKAKSPFGWIDFNGEDYGLSIYYVYGELNRCVLHLHDRNVNIEYFR